MVQLMTIQEQLLMAFCFWIVNKQRLQQRINPEDFTNILAFNQAQIMRQQLEEEARGTTKPKKAPVQI